MIKYQTGGIELIENIAEMWSELNRFHAECSTHFGDEFPSITFDRRKKGFYQQGKQIYVVIAKDNNQDIGYCVASLLNGQGEIESIYVNKKYRGQKVGDTLMNKSLDWLKENKADKTDIYVAVGNESAYKFYEKFGFYPRVTKLTTKKHD